MTGRRMSLVLALFLLFSVTAQAADVTVIAKIQPGGSPSLIATLLGGKVIDTISGTNTYLLRVPIVPIVTADLKRLGLEWVERNGGVGVDKKGTVKALKVPKGGKDPDWYQDQPSFNRTHLKEGLKHSEGQGILIADINTRVDYGHPALLGHLGAGYDFVLNSPTSAASLDDDQSSAGFLDDDQSSAGFLDDDQSSAGFLDSNGITLADDQSSAGFLDGGAAAHGTFTVGIIVAMAPDATIMPLRAFDDKGNTDFFTIAKAIRYATRNGAQVINMSFGTLVDSKVVKDAIDEAGNWGVVLIASAGNNNTSAPQYPAAYFGVIAVASTDSHNRKSTFSNYGSYVFVTAPGDNIISATLDGGYGLGRGTSFSAPIVAGLAALVRSLKYADVQATIAACADNLDKENKGYSGQLGHGLVNVDKTIKTVTNAIKHGDLDIDSCK